MKVFPIEFSHYGIFNGDINVLYLGPTINQNLLGIHQLLHSTFSGIRESCWNLYLPFRWVPHCAIMIDNNSETIHMGLKELLQHRLFEVNVKFIAAVGYKENTYYELLSM